MSALLPKANKYADVSDCPLCANRDRTQRSKIHCLFDHLVGAAEQRKWDYRIPDLDRIQDAAAEPAQEGRIGRFSWRASSSSPILIRQNERA
jgi:hypothetical protein